MKVGCFIPVKQFSERVKGKNFRPVNGIPLYQIVISKAVKSDRFTDIYVDTDSEEVAKFAIDLGCKHIEREQELSKNTANGNDLLVSHFLKNPGYDYYFQIFVTAPLMSVKTIQESVDGLIHSAEHDSVFTTIAHNGFFWRAGMPISYRPDLLPRSQDLVPIEEETTGLYGINKIALDKYRCRIGAKPLTIHVIKTEAIDLNNEDDFAYLDWLVETGRASIIE